MEPVETPDPGQNQPAMGLQPLPAISGTATEGTSESVDNQPTMDILQLPAISGTVQANEAERVDTPDAVSPPATSTEILGPADTTNMSGPSANDEDTLNSESHMRNSNFDGLPREETQPLVGDLDQIQEHHRNLQHILQESHSADGGQYMDSQSVISGSAAHGEQGNSFETLNTQAVVSETAARGGHPNTVQSAAPEALISGAAAIEENDNSLPRASEASQNRSEQDTDPQSVASNTHHVPMHGIDFEPFLPEADRNQQNNAETQPTAHHLDRAPEHREVSQPMLPGPAPNHGPDRFFQPVMAQMSHMTGHNMGSRPMLPKWNHGPEHNGGSQPMMLYPSSMQGLNMHSQSIPLHSGQQYMNPYVAYNQNSFLPQQGASMGPFAQHQLYSFAGSGGGPNNGSMAYHYPYQQTWSFDRRLDASSDPRIANADSGMNHDSLLVNRAASSNQAPQTGQRDDRAAQELSLFVQDDEPECPVEEQMPNSLDRRQKVSNGEDKMSAQQKLLAQYMARQGHSSASTCKLHAGVRTGANAQRLKSEAAKVEGLDNIKIEVDLDEVMQPEENVAWMHNDEGEDEVEALKQQKIDFHAQLKGKKPSNEDMIKLIRLDREIEVAVRRRQLALRDFAGGDDPRQPIYIPDDDEDDYMDMDDNDASRGQRQFSEMADEAHDDSGAEEATKSKENVAGKRRKVGKNAREVEEIRLAKEKEKEMRKKARAGPKKDTLKAHTASQGRNTKKGKAKASNKRIGGAKQPFDAEDAFMRVVKNLVTNDVVAERQALGDYEAAPEIHENVKDKQLKALLASVPTDCDMHRRKVDHADLKRASKRFGFGKVQASDGMWKLKGMKSAMYHHQLLAADWMVGREVGPEEPHGGILADAMGMGKTVEILATLVGNPPTKDDIKQNRKATLIVVPSSVIIQWMKEIRKHVEEKAMARVLHYKRSQKLELIVLQDQDVVLTTYNEVMKSYVHPSDEELAKWETTGKDHWKERVTELRGQLHQVDWYRVVLDEAHAIKNYQSRTSNACCSLRAKYRWALSGTPILNGLDELFPYFRFLRTSWAEDYTKFLELFCNPETGDQIRRITTILSMIMMRRTITDRILGRPIVDLPLIHSETTHVDFSREERALYVFLEDKFRDAINMTLMGKQLPDGYSNLLVMLLRLRQCTAHPYLLEGTLADLLEPSDLLRLRKIYAKFEKYRQPYYKHLGQWIQQTEEDITKIKREGSQTNGNGRKAPFGKGEFGKKFKMTGFLDKIKLKDVERVVCCLCTDLPTEPRIIIECQHIICNECLKNHVKEETERAPSSDHHTCPHPSCRKIFESVEPFNGLALNDADLMGDDEPAEKKQHWTKKNSGDPFPGPAGWLKLYKSTEPNYLLPSAKTTGVKAQLLKWINDYPMDKIIVFTQWRAMAKIVALICQEESIGFVYFTGNMSTEQRHKAVEEFHNNVFKRVMIANLKCGGQSLNLACANRVIIIDLWWNHAVEAQAISRMYRIGQNKEAVVQRFAVRQTIDGRLLKMQEDKIKEIDRAMQDVEGSTVTPLTVKELASLFGKLTSRNGVPFVERDYDYEDEGSEAEPEDPVDEVMGEI